MSEETKAVVECLLCRTQGVGDTLEDAFKELKCKGEETWNPLHKAAIQVDGKLVFELEQKVPDDYKGETRLTGEPIVVKVPASKPKKESNKSKEPEGLKDSDK